MKLLSELPRTDLTIFKVDTFLSTVSSMTAGAALYLLEQANGKEYIKDMETVTDIYVSEDTKRWHHNIRDYFDINTSTQIEGNGPLLTIMYGISFYGLTELLQKGSILLDITGSFYEQPDVPTYTVLEEESAFSREYIANKKIYNVPNNLELVMLQEYASRYELSDDKLYKLCSLLQIEHINKNYSILINMHIPTVEDMITNDINPTFTSTSISTKAEWKMLNILNSVLKHHIVGGKDAESRQSN